MSEAAATLGFSSLLSDERLTRRAVGGDERAFAAIFRRYHQPLYRFCLAIVGNPEDAQDALQNTMIKVLRALPGEERKIDLKPWLYRIAHNESIDLLRRRRETRQLDVEQVAPGYGLAEEAATRERLRRLLTDLHELPERQREVLVMREMSGLDFDEIAAAVDTSAAVARQTLYEARQSLRQMEEGREMSCEAVTKALSAGDGRVTRRRDVRAHLRSCAHCRGFGDEIKSRQKDFAALSPLPAVAAAGMLQGLLGGSQAAAGGAGAGAGGSLAATLGGGAAKTIATSAAVKGVATVAVVAAVGVTAADRSGVIHLGLPGEQSQKSGPAMPGSNASSGHGTAADGAAGAAAGQAAGAGNHKAGGANGKAAGSGSTSATAAAGREHGQGHHQATSHADSKAQAPVEGVGAEHEKQHPEAATEGQGTAIEHKPAGEPNPGLEDEGENRNEDEDGDGAGAVEKPTVPAPPAAKPPPAKEAPENPPKGAAPEAPPPAKAAKATTRTEAPAAVPTDQGKGSEKKP
ncbi:MAG TPA: RNA polymerase sigma factor [Solirubrobacterales bacterium]|jgi:RNA polymerase sigma factor (sigma-70 family)|nr:RNA polymerase sigma factor [Solirubrobacterales bacterium]